jgi:hypothetical protein
MRRRIRRIRQLIPTKFATANRTSSDDGKTWTPQFVTWWMWLGHCYRVRRHAI